MIFNLDNTEEFPDPRLGSSDGLYAVGGRITAERLIKAYPMGIFPYYAFRDDVIQWWAPHRRFVIFPDEIHISHSMKTVLNKGEFQCSINEDFEGVIRGCGMVDGRMEEYGAWLGPELMEVWMELNRRGYAKSVEVWDKDDFLVGGLYGFIHGGVFIGDSMFSLVENASKTALIHLARHMQIQGGQFIDCQLETSHLKSMGARYIDYDTYLKATQNSSPINW